jgi:hypothetical protein
MLPDLKQILNFQHPQLIARYQRDYPDNKLSGEQALQELLKFLWLGQKLEQDQIADPSNEAYQFDCGMHPEMAEIDDMWHSFLLFSKDYQAFCLNYFGQFIHHCPKSPDEPLDSEKYERELSRYLSYTYDHLGEDTLKLWFAEHLQE